MMFSSNVIGYKNLYIPSEVPRALTSMSQVSNASEFVQDVNKQNDEKGLSGNVVGSWLNKGGTNVADEYGEADVGMAWLQEDGPGAAGNDVCSEEEDKVSTEDSTDDQLTLDAKYSTEEYSGNEVPRDSADKIKYDIDYEAKYSTPKRKQNSVKNERDVTDEVNWLQTAGLNNHITKQKGKQIWDMNNDDGLNFDKWHKSTDSEDTLSIVSDDEHIKVEKIDLDFRGADLPASVPSKCHEPFQAKPMLCFNEYGNLTTTYHSPENNSVGVDTSCIGGIIDKKNSIPFELNDSNKKRKVPISCCKETISDSVSICNGDLKPFKQRARVLCENADGTFVSEKELKQAFKEEFMTATTSRYGRTRKRKKEDGFFFGTLNFNELKKITSGSPKKGKGSTSKNPSPEQKGKLSSTSTSLDAMNSVSCDITTKFTDNGVGRIDSHEVKKEIEDDITSDKVQMYETKDSESLVQNIKVEGDNGEIVNCPNNIGLEAEAASLGTSNKDLAEVDICSPRLDNTIVKEEMGLALDVTETEKGLALTKRSKSNKKSKATRYGGRRLPSTPVSDRLLRGRSDVDKIKQALREVAFSTVCRQTRSKKIVEQEVSESGVVTSDYKKGVEPKLELNNITSDSQELQKEDQGISDQTESLGSETNQSKSVDSEPITKSGRVIRKPELMDISIEDKRQRFNREQLRQSGSFLSSNVDQEAALNIDMPALEKEHPCEYMVGDLVWGHIRGNPLWPAMISYDPVIGEYSRVTLSHTWYKVRGLRLYHVQFFNDDDMTYWISPSNVIPFQGFDQLKNHLLDLKEKLKVTKRFKRAHIENLLRTLPYVNKVSGQKYERWISAIEQAKEAMGVDRYERIQRYALADTETKTECKSTGAKVSSQNDTVARLKNIPLEVKAEKKKRGRPRKVFEDELIDKSDSTDGDFSGFDENSSEDKKTKINLVSKINKKNSFAVYCKKHLDKFMKENSGLSEYAARRRLRWRWKKSAQGSKSNSLLKRKHYSLGEGDEWEEAEELTSKRQRTEEKLETRGVYKVVSKEKVCYRCEGVSTRSGTDMIRCKGLCCGVFHLSCLGLSVPPSKDFKCEDCLTGMIPCFGCKSREGIRQKCTVPHCGKFYHEECTSKWPQIFKQRQQEKFVCPRHVCHMCAANADDIGDAVARNPPFTRCLRCPTTYHTGEDCIAAGTEEITLNHHICTKHLQLPKNTTHHVNVNWCFCCSKGGSLLLCDQCPAAFHADCLEITAPDDGYICEDCANGKFPVYGDIVWVKLGLYRWWPGQVLHPRFIPDNIENLSHQQGMFCVHFFGSNDYYWVTRGRTFLYQEGDKGSKANSSKTLEKQFRVALDDALEAYKVHKKRVSQRERRWSEKGNLKPPPYVRIDTNRPVGNVRLSKLDLASVNRCDCDPNSEKPCGSDESCLNRMLLFECVREVCGAGDNCGNQRFQKKQYPNICAFKTENRGWGLKTLQDIKKGEFVIEYVGELIDEEEFRRRIVEMHEVKEENFYFLTIDKDIMIDAGPKGNLARFMNHSCQPNCETQKWTVGGDTRVGLFASEDITSGSELTFNYNLQCVGTEKKQCNCGAEQCSGFIGRKVQKAEVSTSKREKLGKQRRKRRRRGVKISEDECFRCGTAGDLILCDANACPKGYHLECLGLDKLPKGKWSCPWHYCDECGQKSTRPNCCDYCPNSFCRQHLADNLQVIPGLGNVCQDHDGPELKALRGQMGTTAATEDNDNEKGISKHRRKNGFITKTSPVMLESLDESCQQTKEKENHERIVTGNPSESGKENISSDTSATGTNVSSVINTSGDISSNNNIVNVPSTDNGDILSNLPSAPKVEGATAVINGLEMKKKRSKNKRHKPKIIVTRIKRKVHQPRGGLRRRL